MKILLTNHQLREYGGTETWTHTMASELLHRGHDVTIFTFITGSAGASMPAPVVTEAPQEPFDLILINHNTCLGMVQPVKGFKVFTAHGPAHPLERPAQGADAYVAVSEEVRAVMAAQGFYADVIRNPLDLERFQPQADRAGGLFIMCKNERACLLAAEAAAAVGWDYTIAHRGLNLVEDVASVLPEYDYAITSGRGVYEALACGVTPLIFDVRSGEMRADGWVTRDNIQDLVQYNCSGRARDMRWTVEDLIGALSDPPQDNGWGRAWVELHHDVKEAAERYLALPEKVRQRELQAQR